jgi:hypothetical protein
MIVDRGSPWWSPPEIPAFAGMTEGLISTQHKRVLNNISTPHSRVSIPFSTHFCQVLYNRFVIKKKLLIASGIIIVLCLIGVGTLAYYAIKESTSMVQKPTVKQCSVSTDGIIEKINNIRGNPLLVDQSLVNYAQQRVPEVMLDWSHDGFQADNRDYFAFGVGETLAKRYCSDQEVIKAWLESPTHREVMLDERFDHIGIAQGIDSKGIIYVVAIFGDIQ